MGFARNAAFVRDLDAAMGRALHGAAYLDGRLGPGWERQIDLGRLDIGSAFGCVLGQLVLQGHSLTMSLRQGIDGGFSCGLLADLLAVCGYRSPAAARSYALLTAAWKAVIAARLGKFADVNREGAVGNRPSSRQAFPAAAPEAVPEDAAEPICR